ncbi:hypothetical protein [Dendronalium sp. ChiSLP03b]
MSLLDLCSHQYLGYGQFYLYSAIGLDYLKLPSADQGKQIERL